MAHDDGGGPLPGARRIRRLGRLDVEEPSAGEPIRAQPRATRIDDVDAPPLAERACDQGTGVGSGAADDEVERRKDRVEDGLADDRRPPVGNRQRRPFAERIGLGRGQPATLAVEAGEQVGRTPLDSRRRERIERLGRHLRRLRQQLDHAAAAEAHPPQLVALGGVVDRDQHRRIEVERLPGQARRFLLQAPAADEADGRPLLRHEQPSAGTPVRGATHRHDGRQRHPLAARSSLRGGLEDGVDLAHAPQPSRATPPVPSMP